MKRLTGQLGFGKVTTENSKRDQWGTIAYEKFYYGPDDTPYKENIHKGRAGRIATERKHWKQVDTLQRKVYTSEPIRKVLPREGFPGTR